jgi:hypothetical protein
VPTARPPYLDMSSATYGSVKENGRFVTDSGQIWTCPRRPMIQLRKTDVL